MAQEDAQQPGRPGQRAGAVEPSEPSEPSEESATRDPVRYDVDEGVATITLDRPEALNGLTNAAKDALLAAVTRAAEDEAVRCVVLTGAGRGFCAGQDLKEHRELLLSAEDVPLSETVERHYNPTVHTLATMAKPVIAAVNGVAAGAGASLALACDVRLVAESAGFNFAFAGVALSCDTGSSWTLPRLVGTARALDLLYFPRTVRGAEALELGLASRVVPDAELAGAARELAARLAAGPTKAYAAIRRSVAHSAGATLGDALVFEARMMAETGATEDHRAAVEAFVAKQRPSYRGR